MLRRAARALFGPSDAEIAREERRAQAEREEKERARKRQEEKEQREHDEMIRKMEAKQESSDFWEKETKRTQKELSELEETIADLEGESKAAEAELDNQTEKIEDKRKQIDADLKVLEDKVAAAQQKYKDNNDKIRAAIEKTDVDEGSIPQFLNLINDGLLIGTLNNTAKREELNAKIGAFGELMERRTDFKMSIDLFFKGKLELFVEYLKDEEYEEMDDILCDEDEEFEEIVEVITEALNNGDQQKDYKKFLEGKGKAYRDLSKLCLRKKAEKGWIQQQEAKKSIVKKQLAEVSPPLSTFFGVMDEAVTDARRYLEYGTTFNPEQHAIFNDPKTQKRNSKILQTKALKAAVDAEAEEKEKEAQAPDEEEEEKQSTVDIDAFEKERQMQLSKPPKGLNDKQIDELQVARNQNNALMTAAVVKLNVVESLTKEFEEGKYEETRKTGLTLAQEVENCSVEIMRSQATIRGSILIARQLIEFKPAKPGAKAAPLWEVIDAGIINIFENYIEMTKVAATYFAFFVKFKSGFEHFNSCYEIDGEEVDLIVATEYIQRDVKEFGVFKAEMQKVVDKLTKEAKAVISNCVKTTAGAESFDKAQAAREEAEDELQDTLRKLHREQDKLRTEFDVIFEDKKKAIKDCERLKAEVQYQKDKIGRLKKDLEIFKKKFTEIK